jgi:hypothetical protein
VHRGHRVAADKIEGGISTTTLDSLGRELSRFKYLKGPKVEVETKGNECLNVLAGVAIPIVAGYSRHHWLIPTQLNGPCMRMM